MTTPDIQAFFHEPTGTFSYVVADPSSKRGVILDPVLDFDAASGQTGTTSAERIAAHVESQRLTIDWILETHAHADHLTAAWWLQQRLGGKLGIGRGICDVQQTFKRIFHLAPDFPVDGSQFDRLWEDDARFEVGGLGIRVIATPGHTGDSISYLAGNALFVGDTLFMPDVGTARCDFPGGSARILYASVQKLYALPPSTRLFVLHDYPPKGRNPRCETTVRAQRETNRHLRADTPLDEFVRLREERDAGLTVPRLLFPSIQVNIRAGELPAPESNGIAYLRIPLNLVL